MATPYDIISENVGRCFYTIYVYDKNDASYLTMENVIYLFLGRSTGKGYLNNVLYVGKTTERVCDRMSGHHKWDEAVSKGFTYLAVAKVDGRSLDHIEKDFILQFHPLLNEKL